MTNHDMTLCDGKECEAAKTCKRHALYKNVQEEDFARYYVFFCLAHDEGIEKCELYLTDKE